jgi:excinuclease ABC subunit C
VSALALQDLLPGPATFAALKRRVQASAAKRPAVYQFLDASGAVLYVGKAKDLRTRLLSYFTAPWPESKSARLIRCASDVRWRYVPSEFAALLEELRLIQQRRPAYNVRGVASRAGLAFVKLTHGATPKLVVSDQAADPRSLYYGPFRGRAQTLAAVRTLGDLLGLRDCADRVPMVLADQASLFDTPLSPACIRHALGTCLGPCAALCSQGRYRAAATAAAAFLESRSAHPLERALDAMAEASERREYERAAHWRGKLDELTWLFAAVARLRAAVDGFAFVYAVRDETGEGDDRVYLVKHGTVRLEAAWPRTPIERQAFAEAVRPCTLEDAGAPAARTAQEMAQLLLLLSWFRQHPEEYERTSSYQRWLDGAGGG